MSTKRKATVGGAASPADASNTPSAKRRKLPNAGNETAESTTQTGFELLAQLKKSRDKQGWHIYTHFQKLPDPHELPEYYDQIGLPIALDTIQAKLERYEYPTITALESDVKRMISNAKSFNNKITQIYSDAEKVRKLVSNFMVERNPAYRNQSYQAIATPVPEGWQPRSTQRPAARPTPTATPISNQPKEEVNVEEPSAGSRSSRRSDTAPSQSPAQSPAAEEEGAARTASSTPAAQDAEGAGEGFEGNTFQQAQDKIVTEMMNLTDESGLLISANFIQLPPRTLIDYYRIIRHPVSLKALQKQARGAKGHARPTGATLLKSWNAFEEEASYIWRNAREYNEDGSEIVRLANDLERYFRRRLKEAKKVVNEPPQPRVKLTMGGKSPEPPPKITLKFGNLKPNHSSGVSVDTEALKRQQELVRAGVNGQGISTASTKQVTTDRPSSGSEPGAVLNGIKREISQTHSPAPGPSQVNGIASASMPPPSHLTPRLPSGSPLPQPTMTNGATPHIHPITQFNNSFSRPSGKDAFDALIANLNLSTHPDSSRLRFNLDIPASNSRTQQSITITLARSQAYLRIAPTLSKSLMQRPSKTFVTCNHRRQQAVAQRDLDQIHPLYEYPLQPGVNTIEVEVIAGLPRGAPKVGTGNDIEIEKITVFAHLQSY